MKKKKDFYVLIPNCNHEETVIEKVLYTQSIQTHGESVVVFKNRRSAERYCKQSYVKGYKPLSVTLNTLRSLLEQRGHLFLLSLEPPSFAGLDSSGNEIKFPEPFVYDVIRNLRDL